LAEYSTSEAARQVSSRLRASSGRPLLASWKRVGVPWTNAVRGNQLVVQQAYGYGQERPTQSFVDVSLILCALKEPSARQHLPGASDRVLYSRTRYAGVGQRSLARAAGAGLYLRVEISGRWTCPPVSISSPGPCALARVSVLTRFPDWSSRLRATFLGQNIWLRDSSTGRGARLLA
jgi:hypothetical protein